MLSHPCWPRANPLCPRFARGESSPSKAILCGTTLSLQKEAFHSPPGVSHVRVSAASQAHGVRAEANGYLRGLREGWPGLHTGHSGRTKSWRLLSAGLWNAGTVEEARASRGLPGAATGPTGLTVLLLTSSSLWAAAASGPGVTGSA